MASSSSAMNSPSGIPYSPRPGSGWSSQQAPSTPGQNSHSGYFPSTSSLPPSEPVPLTVPKHHPLLYRIPLACSSLDVLRKASISSSSDAPTIPERPPAIPSVSSTSTSLPTLPAITTSSTEWKIRWACYTLVSSETSSVSAPFTANLAPSGQTPRANTLTVPPTPGLYNPLTPPHLNVKGKTRARAGSDMSTASAGGKSSKRARLYPPSPQVIPSLSEKDLKYQRLFGTLSREQDLRQREIFDEAIKSYLSRGNTASAEVKVKEEGEEQQINDAKDYLPERMAFIESVTSKDASSPSILRKLWLFTRRPANLDSIDVMASEVEGNVFPPSPSSLTSSSDTALQLSSTGSFTHSDLFPSLYDNNRNYVSPSSRSGKMNASALQITYPSTTTNGEAAEASQVYLNSVREHLLAETGKQCDLSRQGLGKAMHLGEGLIYPALKRIRLQASKDRSYEEGQDHRKSDEDQDSAAKRKDLIPKGIYLSYDLHFDQLGVVASANLRPIPLCPVIQPFPYLSTSTDTSSSTQDDGLTSRYVRLTPSSSILTLSPVGIQATFIRYYGTETAEMNSKKQAQREKEEIEGLRKQWNSLNGQLTCQGEDSTATSDPEERWVLCRIAEMDIVWPVGSCLVSSYLPSSPTSEPEPLTTIRKKTYTRRYYTKPTARSLLPRKHLLTRLADNTSSYIDRIARERENERRERAEKTSNTGNQTVGNGNSTIMHSNLLGLSSGGNGGKGSPSTVGGGGSPDLFGPSPVGSMGTTPGARDLGSSISPQPLGSTPKIGSAKIPLFSPVEAEHNHEAATSAEAALASRDSHKKSKRPGFSGMVPTLKEIAAMLPPPPPSCTASTGMDQKATTEASSTILVTTTSSDGQIYPTPQYASSNAAQGNSSIDKYSAIDTLVDPFSWSTYASEGFGFDNAGGFGNNAGNSNFGYSESGNQSSFFDTDLSMFDSGLTDEDFSFFDTPTIIPPSVDSASHLPSTTTPAFVSASQAVDDISFITSSEPIDHFGHLMPSGDSPATRVSQFHNHQSYLPAGSSTSPIFLDHPTPASISSIPPVSAALAKPGESPSGIVLSVPQEPRAGLLFEGIGQVSPYLPTIAELRNNDESAKAESFHTLTEIDDIDHASRQGHAEEEKYAVRLLKGPLLPAKASQPLQIQAYSPVDFEATVGQKHLARDLTQPLSKSVDVLIQYRKAKAAALRAYLDSKANRKPSNSLRQSERNWTRTTDTSPESLVFEDSSSSSDSDSDQEEIGFIGSHRSQGFDSGYFGQIGQSQTQGVLGPILLQARQALLGISLSASTGDKAEQAMEGVDKKAATEKMKVNKGEKEALATVFFQQYMENVDIRERNHRLHIPSSDLPLYLCNSALPDLSPHLSLQKTQQTFITVFHHMSIMKMSTPALTYWDKLGLQPHSGPKDVRAFVLAASSLVDETVTLAVDSWLERIGKVYQSSGLGHHEHHTSAEESGPLYTLDSGEQTLSDMAGLQEKLALIGSQLARECQADAHAVIYILITDDECQRPSTTLVQLCLRLHLLRRGILPHLVPLSMLKRGLHLVNDYQNRAFHQSEFSRLAFAIYDRLSVTVHRHVSKRLEQLTTPSSTSAGTPTSGHISSAAPNNRESRICPAPAFKIFPSYKPLISFSTAWPPPTLDILDRHRILHVAYSVSLDSKWLFLAAIDEKGEHHCLRVRFVEGLETKLIVKRIWNFAKEITEPVNVEWRIIIVKAGSMPVVELQAWNELILPSVAALSRPALVSISSIGHAFSTHATSEASSNDMTSESQTVPPKKGNLASSTNSKMPDTFYSDLNPAVHATVSGNPTPVYEEDASSTGPLPPRRKLLYYALCSSSIYFIPKILATTTTASASTSFTDLPIPVHPSPLHGPASYSINLLSSTAHPQSSFTLPLLRNMHDITQSFVNLQVVAKERWSLSDRDGPNIGILPWHLAAVTMLSNYDLDSFLS